MSENPFIYPFLHLLSEGGWRESKRELDNAEGKWEFSLRPCQEPAENSTAWISEPGSEPQ